MTKKKQKMRRKMRKKQEKKVDKKDKEQKEKKEIEKNDSKDEKKEGKQKEDIKEKKEKKEKDLCPDVFYVGNLHQELKDVNQRQDRNCHRWTLFVSSEADSISSCASFIDHVDVDLHPTFDPPTVTLRSDALTLSRLGWGVFDIQLKIHFVDKSRKPVKHVHHLSFSHPRTQAQINVPRPSQPGLMSQLVNLVGKSSLKHVEKVKVTDLDGNISFEDNKAPE